MAMGTYHDLDVYKRAYALALKTHTFSLSLPKELQYDLADQLRRASRSIPANLAEGFGRAKSKKDILNFVKTALGSNDEVIFNLQFAIDANLIDTSKAVLLHEEYVICGKQLHNLIRHLKNELTS